MNSRKFKFISLVGLLFLLPHANARADAGVPMLAVIWPASWVLLVPVILTEAWFAKRLSSLSWKQSLKGSSIANAVSTLIGLPVTWGLLVGAEILVTHGGRAYGLSSQLSRIIAVTVQAPWLIPYESDLYWMVPAAAIVLMVPFLFMSVYIERWVFKKTTRCAPEIACRWSWVANAWSYGPITIILVGMLVTSIVHARKVVP